MRGVFTGAAAFFAAAVFSQPLPLAEPLANPLGGRLDPRIPRPEAVMGHVLGGKHTRSDLMHAYFRAVDQASDRVQTWQYGTSHDGRPLIFAAVSHPSNMARIEEIRRANMQLSENPGSVSDAQLARMPVVLWLGHGVHGNEPSAAESALLTLYTLAATQSPQAEERLRNVVIIIDPLYNPDGHDRFVHWVNTFRGATPTADPQHREHSEAWPGGRTNYYFFDLNRDWLPAQQPESQARLSVYQNWRPQMKADFHEMGGDNLFYFHPGIPTRNNRNTPEILNELTIAASRPIAAALDQIGSLYYTREQFDDFYYGKGSSYPDINGAVGILFEQGSARALRRTTQNGELTFAATIKNQFTAAIGTLEAAFQLRPRLLKAQRDIYASVPQFVADSPVKAYVIDLELHRGRAEALLNTLAMHGVRSEILSEDLTVGGHTYRAGRAAVLNLNQPQARLLRSAMERRTQFPDTGFYDVSAWTLPLAFNVRYAELDRAPRSTAARPNRPAVTVNEAKVAYVFPWGDANTPRLANELARQGLHMRLMTRPFSAGGRTFSAGHVVIPVAMQKVSSGELLNIVRKSAAAGLAVSSLDTSLTNISRINAPIEGVDLGSPSAHVMQAPRVAVVSGSTQSSNAVGEAWHTLSWRWGLETTLLDSVATADLSRYNVIVLTGSLGAVPSAATAGTATTPAVTNASLEALRPWIERGGVLVTTGTGTDWAAAAGLLSLTAKPTPDAPAGESTYASRPEEARARTIPGTILQANFDITHPLSLGLDPVLPVLRRGNTFYTAPASQVVARYAESPLLAGYLPAGQDRRAAGSVAIAASRRGRGATVGFVDNPNFRGFWLGGSAAFANAVYFGNAF